MPKKKITLGLKGSGSLFKPMFTIALTLLLISLLAACASPATTTQAPTSRALATPTTAPATPMITPTTTVAAAKLQGELVASSTE